MRGAFMHAILIFLGQNMFWVNWAPWCSTERTGLFFFFYKIRAFPILKTYFRGLKSMVLCFRCRSFSRHPCWFLTLPLPTLFGISYPFNRVAPLYIFRIEPNRCYWDILFDAECFYFSGLLCWCSQILPQSLFQCAVLTQKGCIFIPKGCNG